MGLALLFVAIGFSFWGGWGVFKQELHWGDNPEGSPITERIVRGGSAVVLSCLIILLGLGSLGGAIYLLSGLEWHPLSWAVFLRVFVLVLLVVGTIALDISAYHHFRRGILIQDLVQETKPESRKSHKTVYGIKLSQKYKGKSAPMPYDPAWLVELAKEQIPEKADVIESLKSCTTVIGFNKYRDIYFTDPVSVVWTPRDHITLYKKDKWETKIWINISTDWRIISGGEAF